MTTILCDSANIRAGNLCPDKAELKIKAYTFKESEVYSIFFFCRACWRTEQRHTKFNEYAKLETEMFYQ